MLLLVLFAGVVSVLATPSVAIDVNATSNNATYIVVGSKTLRPDTVYSVSVNVLHASDDVNVVASIIDGNGTPVATNQRLVKRPAVKSVCPSKPIVFNYNTRAQLNISGYSLDGTMMGDAEAALRHSGQKWTRSCPGLERCSVRARLLEPCRSAIITDINFVLKGTFAFELRVGQDMVRSWQYIRDKVPFRLHLRNVWYPGTEVELTVANMGNSNISFSDMEITACCSTESVVTSTTQTTVQPDHQTTPGTETISLKVPTELPLPPYTLQVNGTGGLTFSNQSELTVASKSMSIFIQTDKAMYKPGQTVLFRVLLVDPELKPIKSEANISIYDKSGNKIVQWLKQKNNTGVISQRLQLSDQTPLGTWRIEVTARDQKVKKEFEVAEYVLPKFEVKVDLPSYFAVGMTNQTLRTNLIATITAKYTFGKPVQGSAAVTIQMKSYGDWDKTIYLQSIKTVQLKDGKADVSMTHKELSSLVPSEWVDKDNDEEWTLSYRSFLFIANVTESATGKTLSGNNSVQCVRDRYRLSFLDVTPNNFKPGLTFTGYLQLKQADGKPPLASDLIRSDGSPQYLSVYVTYDYPWRWPHPQPSDTDVMNITLTNSALIMFSLDVGSNYTRVHLRAEFLDEYTGSMLSDYKSITAFESRDAQNIQVSLTSGTGQIQANQQVAFLVKTTKKINRFSYQVLGKSTMALTGVVEVDTPRTEFILSPEITGEVAQALAPTAHIVVWFITNHGEVVSDSLRVNVDGAFTNQVLLTFNTTKAEPGDNVTLTVNALQGSYVGVLAVDQSVLLLKGGNDITSNAVLDELNTYGSDGNNDRCFGFRCGIDFVRRRKRSIRGDWWWWPIYSGGEDSAEIFQNAGVLVMTDLFVHKHPRHGRPMPIAVGIGVLAGNEGTPGKQENKADNLKKPDRVRSNFPETWMWQDAYVGDNGHVDISATVPDTMTSWVVSAFAMSDADGLGVADIAAKLTVFKPFFISLNLPYSVIRGEEFALQVTVFNYLNDDLDVVVTLLKSNLFTVRDIDSDDNTTSQTRDAKVKLTVASQNTGTVYIWVLPVALGQIPLEVKAQSVQAADAERRLLLVEPPGVKQEYSTALFINMTSGNDAPFSGALNISLPPTANVVPDSVHIVITVIGDLMVQSMTGLESRVAMPHGCGEQNMINFAPDIYILKYLQMTAQLTLDTLEKTTNFILSGYQRELTYQHMDGSFSAFGNSDPSGSVWLSAFVVRCFHEANAFIVVEDDKIAKTLNFIVQNQLADGSFVEPPNAHLLDTIIQGGSFKGVSMTAYVLLAVLENSDNTVVNATMMLTARKNAVKYLENQLENVISDPYALSIITYALTKANSTLAGRALQKLDAIAVVAGGYKHWEKAPETTSTFNYWQSPYTRAKAESIEMTAYALKTCALKTDVTDCVPIVKWIVSQRNPTGGFESTQDTVVALGALADIAVKVMAPSVSGASLTITVSSRQFTHTFSPITKDNALVLQSVEVPRMKKRITIKAVGNGVGLVQMNVKYNVYQVVQRSCIKSDVTSAVRGNNSVVLHYCGRWTDKNVDSGMVVVEISLLTGYSLDTDKEEMLKKQDGLRLIETNGNKVALYFDKLTAEATCFKVDMQKASYTNNVQKGYVRTFRYYSPEHSDVKTYLPANMPTSTSPWTCDNMMCA